MAGAGISYSHSHLHFFQRSNTQYAVVKHTDTGHNHVHMVASLINFEGEYLDLYPAIFRSQDIVHELVREHGLLPPGQKNLRETNFDALDGPDTRSNRC
jgi:Relaxase/Mobilisation nuclease domain